MTWETCQDLECVHGCNTHGDEAFCECNKGFTLDIDGRSCNADIGAELRQVDCGQGFRENDIGDCIDIDECLNKNVCNINENCENNHGSFSCKLKTCEDGYKLNSRSGLCEDIDECLTETCERNFKCYNTPGSYSCECYYGLRKHPVKSHICDDIDECKEYPEICDQKCFNTWASYRCSCNYGFKLSSDNRTCLDINECERNIKDLCPGTCLNTVGSFKCGCSNGMKLIGNRDCIGKFNLLSAIGNNLLTFLLFYYVDINECKDWKNACQGKNDYCLNIIGSFKCIDRQCDQGYRYDKR